MIKFMQLRGNQQEGSLIDRTLVICGLLVDLILNLCLTIFLTAKIMAFQYISSNSFLEGISFFFALGVAGACAFFPP